MIKTRPIPRSVITITQTSRRWLLLAVVGCGLPFDSTNAKTWDVGGRKQLFIDHRFIESSKNIRHVVNPADKLNIAAISPDKPWEAFRFTALSVLKDTDDGLYKMWYSAYDLPQWIGNTIGGDFPGKAKISYICYATSRDGIHWVKPNLGIVDYKGGRNNNIVIAGHFYMKMFSVFRDPHGTPDERFKMIYDANAHNAKLKRAAVSRDGLTWRFPEKGGLTPTLDTQPIAFWDDRINKYVLFTKTKIGPDGTPPHPFVKPIDSNPPVIAPRLLRPNRSVGRLEIDDLFQEWPLKNMQIVMAADELDPPDSDIYNHNIHKYSGADDAYFMFPMVYQHFSPGESPVGNDGVNDVQFAASRDGIHFMRYDRQPYLRRGLKGEPDGGMVWAQDGIVRSGNYLLQYYTNWPYTHGGFRRVPEAEQRDPKATWGQVSINLARQRLDGFVSVDTPHEGGTLTTPPLRFKGNQLELNVDVSAFGETRVEIQDESGRPVPGFHAADCDRLLFNEVDAKVSWKGKSDLSGLKGRTVRLKFEMRSTKLYAFQFRETTATGR